MSAQGATLKLHTGVFLALLALTAATVGIALVDLGAFNTAAALAIAGLKAALVVLFFMHLRWSSRVNWLAAAAGLLWLALLIGFTLSDYVTRGWLPVYGTPEARP